jgi:hypothetical protein
MSSGDNPADSPPPARIVQGVNFLKYYAVLAHGEAIAMGFATVDGGELELRLPALMLPVTLRNLLQAEQAAAQARDAQGLATDLIQATRIEGEPQVVRASDGALVITLLGQQRLPISLALDEAQADALVAALAAARQAAPRAPQQH